MALTIKIDPVERFTEAIIRNDLSLPEQRKAAADFAREGLEEAKQINRSVLGRVPAYTTTVDGRANAALESVNPDGGTIIFEFESIGVVDALLWIAQTLVDRSPEVSGQYKRGHRLLADGTETAWPTAGGNIPPAEVYTFINLEPYARKIEIGKTESGRAFLIQVPNRIYERTAKDAKRKFGIGADIQFTYAQAVGAYKLKRDQSARHFLSGRIYHEPTQRADRAAGSVVSTPAITVKSKRT
jgi:hypothetical protein